ncbi:hypothetical protein BC827DRAFT_1385882 [Russula dissimulans]|nr:hypothetical protein BC827DRAFT_1385882 [Russula dissimulans]
MSDGLNGRIIVLKDFQMSWCIPTLHPTLILLFASHNTPLTHRYRYPYPIPDGTRVPHWAYLDVITADTWNITAAENAGDSPEDSPSSFSQIQTLSATASTASQSSLSTHVSTAQASSTTSAVSHGPSSSPTGRLNRNSLHAGQIVSIVVGVLGTAILITVIFWCFWRRRRRSEEQPSPLVDDVAHMAEGANLPDPGPPVPTQYYDPYDPSTFPPPIVLPPIPAAQTTPSGENGHGTEPTGANGRTEYSGLPLV